jgi:hypothetical protein
VSQVFASDSLAELTSRLAVTLVTPLDPYEALDDWLADSDDRLAIESAVDEWLSGDTDWLPLSGAEDWDPLLGDNCLKLSNCCSFRSLCREYMSCCDQTSHSLVTRVSEPPIQPFIGH